MSAISIETKKVTDLSAVTSIADANLIPVHDGTGLKKITFANYTARELPVAIIKGGKLVYDLPKLKDIRAYAAKEMDSFWEEYKRLDQPHVYKVDLSDELYALKTDMLDKVRRGENV